MKFNNLFVVTVFLLVIAGCQKRPLSWDVDNTVPLFKTTFSMDNLDTRYITSSSTDSSYFLNYSNTIYSYKINDLQASDTGIEAAFSLSKLRLNDQVISNTITLGDINPLFKALDGQNMIIPAQDQQNLDPTEIDASAFFETATLDTGYLDITITNELPVNISLIEFELRNKDDNSVIASDQFTNISPNGGFDKKTIDLGGKTVNKTLIGVIKRLVTDQSASAVTIDVSKGIKVDLGVRQLRPSSAIAAFPTQDVIDQDEGLTLYMGGAEVKYFKVASGRLKIDVFSTVREDLDMYIELPGAIKDGKKFVDVVHLDAAEPGGSSQTNTIYEMAGYLIDFRGKNPTVTDTVNTFHQILKVTLDSSGRKIPVNLSDSIRLDYKIEGLKPEYAIGYLGNSVDTTGIDTVGIDLFKGLTGDVEFQDFDVNFLLRNSIGTDGRINLNKLSSINAFSGNKIDLIAPALTGDLFVTKPPFQRGQFSETSITLNPQNSNVKEFFENLPQLLEYDLETEISPNGNVNNYTDFVFDDSRMDVILNVNMPFSFSFGGLTLRDTQGVNFSEFGDISRLKSAKLFLEMENYFPLDLVLNVNMLDKNYRKLGTFNSTPTEGIPAATLDANGFPINSSTQILIVELDRERAKDLINTHYFEIVLEANGSRKMQKLYNNSKLIMNSRIQFEYELQND